MSSIRRSSSVDEGRVVSFIIHKSKETEATSPYDAKAWLLTGKSVVPRSFPLQYEAFSLEKRLENVEGTAYNFEQLFRGFSSHIDDEITDMASAVRVCTLSKGKETKDQKFLYNVFTALSKETQIEILIQCTELSPTLFDKCQTMLLLVKLFPDTINQKNGGEMLFTLLSCESDAFSTFRKLLVVELVPSVLQLSQNIPPSPRFLSLLNQCIEYYVLVDGGGSADVDRDDRWDKLFTIVDQIGAVMKWNISPFFKSIGGGGSGGFGISGGNSIESFYQSLNLAFQHRNHYTTKELAYVAVVVFLRSVLAYYEMLRGRNPRAGDKPKLLLVEVFTPRPHRNALPDRDLHVLTTVSNCSSVSANQGQVIQHFLGAVKIWEMVSSLNKGEELKQEFFDILYSLHSLNLQHWDVFKEFMVDYHTYIGYFQQDQVAGGGGQNLLKLASMYCSFNNFKLATECCIKAITEAVQTDPSSDKNNVFSTNKEDFTFYNPHIYNTDPQGNFIFQRRVHFLSENKSEVLAYAVNILIRSFHESIDVAATSKDDRYLGHLMTLLQLEWPSPPAEMIFNHILDIIKRNRSFRYFPFFGDFVVEPDFLETFMGIANHEGKNIKLDLFPVMAGVSSGRRIGTRGVEKGSKTEFRTSMQRQMGKNGVENLEMLIYKFLTLNKVDILTCFDY